MRVRIDKLGEIGVITDTSPSETPPNALSEVNNVRCEQGRIQTVGGYSEMVSVSAGTPLHVAYHQESGAWVYVVDSTGDGEGDEIWEYVSSAEDEITRGGGTPDAYTGTADLWTHTYLSGALVLNGFDDAPQYYTGTGDCLNMPYTDVANSTWEDKDGDSSNKLYRAKSIRAFKNYLFAINIQDEGINYPHLVHWTDAIAPGDIANVDWDYTDASIDSARRDLADTPGEAVDGLPLRDSFIVYKEDAVYGFTFSNDEFVFRSRLLTRYRGILSTNCAVDIGGRHVVIGPRDIYIHDGSRFESIAEDKTLDRIFNSIDADYQDYTYLTHNISDFEVWFCFVPNGATKVTKRWIFNYRSGQWTCADMPGAWFVSEGQLVADTGVIEEWDDEATLDWDNEFVIEWAQKTFEPTAISLVAASEDDKLYAYDSSQDKDGTTISAFIERTDLDIGDSDDWHEIQAIYPRMSGNAVTITTGYQDRVGGPVTYDSGISFDPDSDHVIYPMVNGRKHAFRITGDVFSVDGMTIEYVKTGGV